MISGAGAGLRSKHFSHFIEHTPNVSWLELLADNYLDSHGILLEKLQTIRGNYPMVLHGVNLSVGGTDPINQHYLAEIKRLIDTLNITWFSDHLCWSSHNYIYYQDLFPLPFTQQTVTHVVERIKAVQDYLQQRILIENISSYLEFASNSLFEAECLAMIAEQADCYILLDVNNIYVNSQNHHFDATVFLDYLDAKRIKQIHLGGYTQQQSTLVDTHGEAVHDPVWLLYQTTLQRFGNIPTNIEWDNNVPDWPEMQQQIDRINHCMRERDAT
jgi:uncharacterized protein (UPF0276 family)